jgi:hypothetical protein
VLKGSVFRVYPTKLLGDVTKDGTVDVRDISRISKMWEVTDLDPLWLPLTNLKLSDTGPEIIDIRDISRASKCWELKE